VPISECQAVAEALLEVQATSELQSPQNHFGSGRGKPQFPSVINLSSRLMVHYVLLAGLLPVTEWDTRAAHIFRVRNFAAVNVVNDGAE